VSFATITLFITSQRVFIVVSVYFIMTQSGNFWIPHRVLMVRLTTKFQPTDSEKIYYTALDKLLSLVCRIEVFFKIKLYFV
jgi:hypothetical protein